MSTSAGKRQIRIKRYGSLSLVREVVLETSKVKVRDIILEAVETKSLGQPVAEWLEGSTNSPYIVVAGKKTVGLDELLDEDVKEIELRLVVSGG